MLSRSSRAAVTASTVKRQCTLPLAGTPLKCIETCAGVLALISRLSDRSGDLPRLRVKVRVADTAGRVGETGRIERARHLRRWQQARNGAAHGTGKIFDRRPVLRLMPG